MQALKKRNQFPALGDQRVKLASQSKPIHAGSMVSSFNGPATHCGEGRATERMSGESVCTPLRAFVRSGRPIVSDRDRIPSCRPLHPYAQVATETGNAAPMGPALQFLVPVDFSKGAVETVRWGAKLAEEFGGSVFLLHVLEISPWLNRPRRICPPISVEEAIRQVRLRLNELMRSFIPPAKRGSILVRLGRPAAEIARCLEELEFDCLIMCRCNERSLKRLVGRVQPGTAARVVRRIACPTLVIPDVPAVRPSHAPSQGRVVRFNTIFAPVDFTEHSRSALKYAVALASSTGAGLTLFGVLPNRHSAEFCKNLFDDQDLPVESRVYHWASPYIPCSIALRILPGTGIPAAEVISHQSELAGADLIVIHMETPGSVGRFLGNGHIPALLRTAKCPVLVVPEQAINIRTAESTTRQWKY